MDREELLRDLDAATRAGDIELARLIDKKLSELPAGKQKPDFTGSTLRLGPFDTGIPLPSGAAETLAQLGSGFADIGLGARQIAGKATNADADEKRALDAPLLSTPAGKAMNFIGNTLPFAAAPLGWMSKAGKAAPIVENAVASLLGSALQPTGEGESRAVNTAIGTTAGAGLPAAFMGAKWLVGPSKEAADAARLAAQFDIPVGPADVSTNKIVRATKSVIDDIPGPSLVGAAQKEAKQTAFNRAVGRTFGVDAPKITPEVLDSAIGRGGTVSKELDRIWNKNVLDVDVPLVKKLIDLKNEAIKLPRGEGTRLIGEVDDFLTKMQPKQGGGFEVAGDVANKFQSSLRTKADSASGFLQTDLKDLRRAIISAFNRSVSGADADALTKARTQYKAAKTVQDLVNKSAVGTAGRLPGDIPPALLPEAVRGSYRDLTTGAGKEMRDLASAGSRFVADRTMQTGGSPRALIQNLATGGMLLGGGAYAPIETLLGIGGLTGMNALMGSPALLRMGMSPMSQTTRHMLLAPSLAAPGLLAPTLE